jgi:Xaa-Pro dipeptidase
MDRNAKDVLRLDDRLIKIVESDYPRFSEQEMTRRRKAVAAAMGEAGIDHLVAHGGGFRGGPVTWLTQWLVTVEAQLVHTPGQRDVIAVQYFNHVPLARRLAPESEIRWGGRSTIETTIDELEHRGAKQGKIGIVGSLPFGAYRALVAKFGEPIDMNRAFARLRLVKSAEELDWYRIGARLSDLSIEALQREMRPGMNERDLGAIVEGAYLPWGGVNVIHFFAVNSMRDPVYGVPRQHPSTRPIQKGDVMSTEITANFWDYGGQVLRTYAIGEELSPRFRDLHAAADAAFDAILKIMKPGTHAEEIVRAAQVIEDAGFTTYDDLTHGGGGGYGPPVVGSPSRQNEPIPDFRLVPGMLVVVQPNVVTKDASAGIQMGECVLITDTAAESLHTVPRGPYRVG